MILSIVISILIGALVGWLAGKVMESKHGFWMNCLLGIIGGAVGSAIGNALNIGGGNIIVSILLGVVGTIIVIAIVRLIMGKRW
ncbi:MAG TPA: GlsB/YeaQ/YmgE family stress response membrane protein [Treponema sp.]|jgi:uncharacterized membrane protein YeaQ/YmgE (transglycosylase-associated protein family)|nr:GlsB/YeaQ/YmgE family stress response membrane protein [Treponema sp.]HAK68213.1 GlsB/YeaQ/YmgE family stress response membrane protein [Treponema sp.]HBB43626.1 GlsB/YeaQ/YmgE family stress response membrane protein [Treponema sp.]HCA19373.1 GlsB/YeaQ/YmgE family stress response membrane protein [Treponema sp.]